MAGHPYSKHSENAVGHRRANKFTIGREYARGGHADEAEDKALIKRMLKKEEKTEGKAIGGPVNSGRLDKRARGGKVKGYQMGGPVRKLTPSKHKPHMNINIVNAPRGGGGGGGAGLPRPRLGLAGAPGLPLGRPVPPVGLAPPIRPPGIVPPMKRGGKVRRFKDGGPAQMRKGKKAGQDSGAGRLEEFKHLGGKP